MNIVVSYWLVYKNGGENAIHYHECIYHYNQYSLYLSYVIHASYEDVYCDITWLDITNGLSYVHVHHIIIINVEENLDLVGKAMGPRKGFVVLVRARLLVTVFFFLIALLLQIRRGKKGKEKKKKLD